MWTKRQLIEHAFEELGLSAYVYDLSPQQMQSALESMDALLASWNGQGVRIGYNGSARPTVDDLDDPAGVPDWAHEAIYLRLAIRLAPRFGKQVAPALADNAKQAYDVVLKRVAFPPEMQMPVMPAGAGHRGFLQTSREFLAPENRLTIGPDNELELP